MRPWARLLPAVLIAAHLSLGMWAAFTHSATYDEGAYIAFGHALWRTGRAHPPLRNPVLAPLLLTAPGLPLASRVPLDGPEYRGGFLYAFAERFLYWSGNNADALILSARMTCLTLSCLLAMALWGFSRSRWGEFPALAALSVYAFSPTVLSQAAVATNDFPASFFAALAALAMLRFLEAPSRKNGLAVFAAMTSAALCKSTALLLWPAFLVPLLYLRLRRGEGGPLRCFLLFCALPASVVLALYAGLHPDSAGSTLYKLFQAGSIGHPNFLLGRYSDQGWRAYYLVAVLCKSTLTEILLAGFGFWLLKGPSEGRVQRMLLPAVFAFYFAAASWSHKQLGLRYILPVYCLLPLIAAEAVVRLRSIPWLPVLLAAGHIAGSAASSPHQLAYFNMFCGGPSRGHRILVDSNLDWGQDLKRLARWHEREGRPELILAYFGTASPEYYGVVAQRLAPGSQIMLRWWNTDRPSRELLAVSATHLAGTYLPAGERLAWLEKRRPIARVGSSFFIYDLSADADAHRRLAGLYAALGDDPCAARERRRAAVLETGQ